MMGLERKPDTALRLSRDGLDRLMPMSMVLTATGHIGHAAPVLLRVLGQDALNRRLFEVAEPRQPRNLTSFADLARHAPCSLRLRLRARPDVVLNGQAVDLPDGQLFLNFSLSLSSLLQIDQLGLRSDDFAPTDLTPDLLYLAEAKNAAMAEAARLHANLDSEKRAAEQSAMTDALTGLLNRRGFDHGLGRFLVAGIEFGLMHIDLDRFKAVNDTHGHAAGDAILGSVARALRAETRRSDLIARVGGDEFIVVLRGLSDRRILGEIGERIIRRIEQPVSFGGHDLAVSASIGVALAAAGEAVSAEDLIARADAALYVAKGQGRGCVRFDEAA